MNCCFTAAEKKLLATAQNALISKKEEAALTLAQALLRIHPASLEARKLARQAAEVLYSRKKKTTLKIFLEKKRAFFLLIKIKSKIQKKEHAEALIALEKLLGDMPELLVAHRLMARVALALNPPLYDLALLEMEEVVKRAPQNLSFCLELARVALLVEPHEGALHPARALEIYQHILAIDPHHLEAQAGIKNASALLSIKQNGWNKAHDYRDLLNKDFLEASI